jgi:hypothetical protein
VSHDPERKYKAVVAQMGRVTLEADINEGVSISGEEQRQEALEVIGPWGSPDNGFKISKATTGLQYDFKASAGTIYIGGERIRAFDDITYSTQSDWIDRAGDPTYLDPKNPAGKTNELIYLYVEETEVSAVEDTALLESALGGPDSSARTRLIARLKRFGTNESTCEKALADARTAWLKAGMALDLTTMRLMSLATLEVSFTDGGGTASDCEPPSVAGYIGADNQLIRIRVATDPQTGTAGLLWGYDNASVLYRIDTTASSQSVTLHQAPVDQKHWPRAAQWVETLRSAAQLDTGSEVLGEELSHDDYVAAPTGVLTTVASVAKPFDPDQLQLMLSDAVAFTSNPSAMPPAFLRMWEGLIKGVQLNKPVSLLDAGGSGIGVNITLNTVASGDILRDGDFWLIGLRPNQSSAVYPARIKDLPQRADGPRRWVCPLAVVNWNENTLSVLEECRNPFDNLVDLSKRFPPTAQKWPVVNKISWDNDGVVSLPEFNDRGLVVEMSRAMNPATVCEQTFQVWIDLGPTGEPTSAFDFFRLPYGMRGWLGGSGNTYTFKPAPKISALQLQRWIDDQAPRDKNLNILTRGIRCRVVLKGDTILDFDGNPLDGDVFGQFLPPVTRLILPSGDGTKGGDFNSWFFLALPPPLEVTGIIPAVGASLAPCAIPDAITVTFNDNVNLVVANPPNPGITVGVTDKTTTSPLSGDVTFSANQAVFKPTAWRRPPGKTDTAFKYTVTVHGGQIVGSAGAVLLHDYVSTFLVKPFTGVNAPAIDWIFDRSIPPLAIGFRSIKFSFDKSVDLSGVQLGEGSTTLTVDSGAWNGTVSVGVSADKKSKTVTFTPDQTTKSPRAVRRTRAGLATTPGTPPGVDHIYTLIGADITDSNKCHVDGAGTAVEGSSFPGKFTLYPQNP